MRPQAGWRVRVAPYIAIARPDHWFKNVFVLPGIVFAIYADHGLLRPAMLGHVALALLATCIIASSYYVLNETLDAPFDALHPLKKNRPVPSGRVVVSVAYGEWLGLAVLGLALAALVSPPVLIVSVVLWLMSCAYNIPPVRTKDKAYLDVLSESVNNPLRLLIGWYCTGIEALPPASLVAAYWMIGAFFMAVKRFAEYRRIDDPARAAVYRRSFAHYTEERLLVSIVYYAVAFGLFFGIFLLRYRLELILSVPLIAGFIAYYIHLGFLLDSPTQTPERLFRQTGFSLYALFCVVVMLGLMFVHVPVLGTIFVPTIAVQH
jgi:4-hydroxybenzoate polyprenyltransferase